MFRVGIGYDIHRFNPERKLILGGVEFPGEPGLEGHSDADVLCHAIADALLGSIGEHDIGYHFPNNSAKTRGMSSLKILSKVAAIIAASGARPVNVDATVIAERPKLGPHRDAMRAKIAEALGLARDAVGIKATTNERIGAIGRGEGIAAMAVACVEQTDPFPA